MRPVFPRGTTLGTVLLVLTVALTLVFTSASVGMFNLRFSTALDNRDHARDLAESAIFQALANVTDDPNYGVSRSQSINVTVPDLPPGASGVLTFDPGKTSLWGCRYSTNNYQNGTPASGDGRQVPHNTVHLVGLGRCGDARCQMEMLFYKPAYPQALASTGNISVAGLTLAAMRAGATFPGSADSIPDADQQPGTLFSNSGIDGALAIGPGCNITGSAGAVGTITVAPGSTVHGELRPNTSAEAVPELDVAGILSRVAGMSGLGTYTAGVPLDRFVLLNGNQSLNDVVLKGGLLAVQGGDLTINGSVTGNGAIVVGGKLTVNGGATLQGDANAALVATGDVHLNGSGVSQYFQGLVYSQGNIYAKDITVLGSVVANGGTDPQRGRLKLSNMTLVQTPVSVQTAYANPIDQSFTITVQVNSGGGHGGHGHGHSSSVTTSASILVQLASRPDPLNTTNYQYFGYVTYTGPSGQSSSQYYVPEPKDTIFQAITLFLQSQIAGLASQPSSGGHPAGESPDQAIMDALNNLTITQNPPPTIISFNLNTILDPADTSRVLLFREIPAP